MTALECSLLHLLQYLKLVLHSVLTSLISVLSTQFYRPTSDGKHGLLLSWEGCTREPTATTLFWLQSRLLSVEGDGWKTVSKTFKGKQIYKKNIQNTTAIVFRYCVSTGAEYSAWSIVSTSFATPVLDLRFENMLGSSLLRDRTSVGKNI